MNERSSSPEQKQLPISGVIAMVLMLAGCIATLIWGSDRCLGLTDEGTYLLAARFPEEVRQNVSSVYVYTGFLFRLAAYSPRAFRLLGVLLVCGSALACWAGFKAYLHSCCPQAKTFKHLQLLSLLFIVLGALLLYQCFYLTPNYNTLIAVSTNTVGGASLFGLAQLGNPVQKKRRALLSFAACGLGIGLAMFVKFPAGLSLLLLCGLFIALCRGIAGRQKIIVAAFLLVGVLAWCCAHFSLVQSPQDWWRMFREGWSLYQTFGRHTPDTKSVMYVKDLLVFVYSAVRIYWPCYAIIGTSYLVLLLNRTPWRVREKHRAHIALAAMVVAALISVKAGVFIGERKPVHSFIPFFLVFHLAWVVLLVTLRSVDSWFKTAPQNRTREEAGGGNVNVVLGLLLALPIAGSVGTSNPLYNVPLCHAASWFAAVLLLVVVFAESERAWARLVLFPVLVIGAFSASQVIQGYVYDAQEIGTNVVRQCRPTQVGVPAKTLKLDEESHRLIKELTALAQANGFQPGDDIIAVSLIPGVVYGMGGRSPGHPTFVVGWKEAEDYSRLALGYAGIDRLRNALVLLNVEPDQVSALLECRGLSFPSEYRKLGTVGCRGKNFTLWSPTRRAQYSGL